MFRRQGQVKSIDTLQPGARWIWVLFMSWCFSGCARLPAIDPNGQGIFLPYPATTNIELPRIHPTPGRPSILPNEAYPTPLAPPPCLDGSCNQGGGGIHNLFHHKQKKHAIANQITNHFTKKDPSQCGVIQLSPQRIVAPVDGEVLLLAGICGKDGYLMKREPLEWMLAPGSVGNFIEVGDDAKGKLCASLRSGPKVEKLGVDYARGRTSSRATVLTKGTPGCDDDLEVLEGQTWLSISSPNEGVSRVTVLAPDSELWDKRRQTATIYWVDSAANFPAPVRLIAPGPATLTTRVTRSQNRPAVGWRVRYTIVDPNIAAFVPPIGTHVFVAETDQNGMATVNIAAAPNTHGTTAVHMEVIRPAQPDEDLPELVLHQTDTFVTFSSPGLEVMGNGPSSAGLGQIVEYVGVMANPGDIDTENSMLIVTLPPGTSLIEASPQPTRTTSDGLLWDQGVLLAQQELRVSMLLRMDAEGDKAVVFRAQGNGLERQAQPVVTRVVKPSLDVSFRPTTESSSGQAEVGQLAYYAVGIRNTGPQTLVNVEVLIETSPGWQEAGQNSNIVRRIIPMLQPSQADESGLALRILQEGRHTARLTVKSGDIVLGSVPAEFQGIAPRPRTPRMEAAIRTLPDGRATLGQKVYGYFTVTNTGETTLNNLEALVKYDAALQAVGFDPENASRVSLVDAQSVRWVPPALQPGAVARLVLEFNTIAPVSAAGLTLNVVNETLTQVAQNRIEIVQAASAPGGSPVLPPNTSGQPSGSQPSGSQPSGSWQVSLSGFNNPSRVGVESRFVLTVRNAQNVQDSNLIIELALPQGVDFMGITDSEGNRVQPVQNQGVWTLPTQQFIRANDTLRYTIVIIPRVPQEASVSTRVRSNGVPTPQIVTERFLVIPQ